MEDNLNDFLGENNDNGTIKYINMVKICLDLAKKHKKEAEFVCLLVDGYKEKSNISTQEDFADLLIDVVKKCKQNVSTDTLADTDFDSE